MLNRTRSTGQDTILEYRILFLVNKICIFLLNKYVFCRFFGGTNILQTSGSGATPNWYKPIKMAKDILGEYLLNNELH